MSASKKFASFSLLISLLFLPFSSAFAAAGDLDLTFGSGGMVTTDFAATEEDVQAIAVQTDGKIVAAGYIGTFPDYKFALARYNTSGSLDTTFDTDGKVITEFGADEDVARAVVIQTDGKIVAAGYSKTGTSLDVALARYNSNGSLDTTFDTDGKVVTDFGADSAEAASALLQTDGKIIIGGAGFNAGSNDFLLARYNTNGSLDTAFDTDGKVFTHFGSWDGINSIALDSGGKIVAGGITQGTLTGEDFALARYNTDGALDTTFDTDGKVTTDIAGNDDHANSLAIQTDGKIILAGGEWKADTADFAMARYTSSGALDTTFDTDGKLVVDFAGIYDSVNSIRMQSDGRIIACGFSGGTSGTQFAMMRFNANGSPDSSFSGDGKVNTVFTGAVHQEIHAAFYQPGGKIYAAGLANSNAFFSENFAVGADFAIARYEALPPTAAAAEIGGRVLSSSGLGLGNVLITLSGGFLTTPVFARTNSFGYYKFEGLAVGETYVLNISAKRHTFLPSSVVIELKDDLTDVNFISKE